MAQYNIPQNDVWAFAISEGVKFSPGPASITTSSITEEGSAAVSDNSGNLLFYTGGISGDVGARVYDRTGAIMPHGSSIVPFSIYSCTQGAAIVPVIGNPNQYYVFSLEQGGAAGWYNSAIGCRLYYCIVDMTLNGGLGDVISSTIATPLDSGLCEKMTVVGGNGCNIWLLAHKKDAPHFKAYNITSSGISTPVVSTSTGEIPTGPNAYKIGTIKVSPDRTMIANCVMHGGYPGSNDRLELLQFDASTGIVSGCQVLNNFTNQYDAEFSPDNSKIYVHVMGSKVYQYDLSLLPDIAAVISSQFLVYSSPNWGGQMKLGPDGKIYIQTAAAYLDCINSPNLSGSSCDYTYHSVHLAGYASVSNLGMPNMQVVANLTDTITSRTDTAICALATLNAPYVSSWYSWSNGSTTRSTTITGSGVYWVKSAYGCSLRIDTFNVTLIPSTLTATVTTTNFCPGSSAVLTAPVSYTAHVWNTGATTPSITVITGGTYRVADTNFSTCSLYIDTFHVTAVPLAFEPTVTTTNFCIGASAVLTAPASYAAHVWNTGVTTSSITVTAAGIYHVADTNFSTCILYTDTFHVTTSSLALIPTVTTTNFCIGTSAVLTAPASYTAHVWNTGATTASITVSAAGTYRVADTNLSTCSLNIDTFHVAVTSLALIPTVTTTNFCIGTSAVLIAPASYAVPLWSTGTTTASITVSVAGTYRVTDTNYSTCIVSTDTFHVAVIPLTSIPIITTTNFCTGTSAILSAPAGYTAHVWSTGATAAFITVSAADTYRVADTNFSTCSLYTDTFHVTVTPPALIPVVTTTNFCTGSSVILTAPVSYTVHVWNTGVTTPSITVTAAGTYRVADTNFSTCNLYIDTFHVTATPPAIIPTLTTVNFCTGASEVLSAPAIFTAHIWNTGDTTFYIAVSGPGIYWVADAVNYSTCSLHTDTFDVTTNPLTLIPAVTTANFCSGRSVVLYAPASFTSQAWNTGAMTSSIAVTAAGTYWVADTNFSNCRLHIDTFFVTEIPSPLVALGKDTTICAGDSITLSSPTSIGSFFWSNGSTASSTTVQTGGKYYLTVTDQGCSVTDSITISQLSAPSPIDLGPDTILCKNEVFILETGSGSTLWSTGVIANSIIVRDSGTYSATITNACGSSTSHINVKFEPCDIDFPNAFTPNNDGRNDVARAIGNLSVFKDYTLNIYNRFGQRVFYTQDIYAGWDGTFNDVPQELDTYFYFITYTYKGKHGMLKGDLTLIR